MADPIKNDYIPLNAQDIYLIHQITHEAIDRKLAQRKNLSKRHFAQERSLNFRAMIANMRQLLTTPNTISAKKVGKIFRDISSTDRLILLNMRPTLIRNYHDLEFIISEFIPTEERLLFICSQIHLLFDPNREQCVANIKAICEQIPEDQRMKLQKFSEKILMQQAHIVAAPIIETSALHSHAHSFSTAFLLSAAYVVNQLYGSNPIINITTFLGAAAFFAQGFYDLYQHQPNHQAFSSFANHLNSLWNQSNHPLHSSTQTPAPRL